MKALVFVADERVEVRDEAEPVMGAGEVVVGVTAAGICGSDIHGFIGHSPRRRPPLVLGHEAVGVVADAHSSVTDWKRGRRVYVNPLISCLRCAACLAGRQNCCEQWKLIGMDRLAGAFAERVAVPASQLYPVSEHVKDEQAVLAEPLACLVHAFRISLMEPVETVAVFGAGTIGALGVALAKLRGARRIFVVDRAIERLEAAEALGADVAINSDREDAAARIRKETGCVGVDFVVEAIGIAATRRSSLAACRKGGRMVFLGLAENESAIPWVDMIRNEQAVFTSFAYAQQDFQASIRIIESGKIDLSKWTEVRTLNEGQESFMKMTHRPGGTLKLMFRIR